MTAYLLAALLSLAPSAEVEQQFRRAEAIRAAQPARARSLYERAARAGHAGAQAALGSLMFRDGNRTASLSWLKAAADQDNPRGLLLYGTALFNGDGLPVDRAGGFAMVSRAAAAGLAEAAGTRDEMQLVLAATDLGAVKATVQPANPSAARSSAVPPESWQVQLGAFRRPGAAQSLFGRLGPQLPGKQPTYVPLGDLTRLLVGPYGSRTEAQAACRKLGPKQGCFPVAPG